MTKKIHIAFLVRAFIPGGAEKMVLQWMHYISAHHADTIQCSLLVLQPSKSGMVSELPVHQVHFFNVWSRHPVAAFFALKKWCIQSKPDILHAHLPFSGIVSVLLSWAGFRGKKIYTEHSFVNRNKPSFWLHGFFYPAHHHIHCVSKSVEKSILNKRKLSWYHNKNMTTLYSGIPMISMGDRTAAKPFTIGTACIFRKDKQLPEMVKLIAKLNQHFGDRLTFCIIGDGPERPALEQAIDQNGLKDKVILPGLVYNLAEHYKQLDFFLMTSRREGLPLALLEAMQQGCIPVVTPIGGIKEVPVKEVGMFINPEQPEILIQFIESIMQLNAIELDNLRQKSRQIVLEHFSLDKQIPELLGLYRKILND